MRDKDLYARILGVEAPWTVSSVQLNLDAGEVVVHVEWSADERPPCPSCGKPSSRHDTRVRRWRHLDTCQYRTILSASVPRVECAECLDHGVRQIDVPWSDPGSRFTAMFESLVIDWLHEASASAVARLLHMTWDQVDGVMQRAVARGLSRRSIEAAPRTGVDETSFRKRHEYVTVVSDLDTSEVLYVSDDRKTSSLDGWYEQLDGAQLSNIEVVSMDMSAAYIKSTRRHVPDADRKIAFDRFHVAKLLSDRVDQVRRAEQKTLKADADDRLTRTRYDWLQNPETMSDKRWDRAQRHLRDATLKTARAWRLKEAARMLWSYRSRHGARRGWMAWLAWAQRCRLTPMVQAARTIRKHLEGIVTAVVNRATNAGAESFNAKIQRVKRMACGYRNRERFKNAIYFHLGGLELYPTKASHTES